MPTLTIPNSFTNNVSTVDATTMNANFNQVATIVNGIDNVNIGTLGIYASQVKPTSVANATFGGTQIYTFPAAIIPSAGSPQILSGTGAPASNLPNASLFQRYDGGSGTSLYLNTSGASSSGTTWTAVNPGAVYASQGRAIIAYTVVGNETNASPGVMASISFTTPTTSPGTNNNWLVIMRASFTINVAALNPTTAPFGIGCSAAGTSGFPMYAKTSASSLTITGGNARSDAQADYTALNELGSPQFCEYSAVYANNTALTITALMGAEAGTTAVLNGGLTVLAIPN